MLDQIQDASEPLEVFAGLGVVIDNYGSPTGRQSLQKLVQAQRSPPVHGLGVADAILRCGE